MTKLAANIGNPMAAFWLGTLSAEQLELAARSHRLFGDQRQQAGQPKLAQTIN